MSASSSAPGGQHQRFAAYLDSLAQAGGDRAVPLESETAVNGRADALVTFNVRDFATVPARFGIELMIPREAIGRMRR